MKNLFLSFCAGAFALLATGCSSGSDKAEVKKNFVGTCMTALQRDFGDAPAMQEHIKIYCECSADKILESFTESEIKKLDTAPDDPGLNAKRDAAIAPCKEAFIQKAAGQ